MDATPWERAGLVLACLAGVAALAAAAYALMVRMLTNPLEGIYDED